MATITREELTAILGRASKSGKNIDEFVAMMKNEKFDVPVTSKDADTYWKSKYTTYRSQLAAQVTKLEEAIAKTTDAGKLTLMKEEVASWQKLQQLTHLKTKNRGKTAGGKNKLLDMLSFLEELDTPVNEGTETTDTEESGQESGPINQAEDSQEAGTEIEGEDNIDS